MNKKLTIKEFVIMDLFSYIWKNKHICIFFTLAFGLIFYFTTPKIKVEDHQSVSIIKEPPNLIFSNFVNKYDIFFINLYSKTENASNELNEFNQSFKLNITSLDNFIFFLNKKGYSKLIFTEIVSDKKTREIVAKKDQQKYLLNKFGFLTEEGSNKYLKIENTEAIYFSHKANLDGPAILNDYILFCYDNALNNYVEKKKEQFHIVLEKFEAARKIAINIGVKNPFYLDPEIDFKNQQLSSFFNTSKLYFRGSEILGFEINDMKNSLNEFEVIKSMLAYNPVVDSAYVGYKSSTIKGKFPRYIKGFLIGFFLSLAVIYFKSLVLDRKKLVKS